MGRDDKDENDDGEELVQLPGGRHGLPPEFVAQHQRERIFRGLAAAVKELGYRKTTIVEIARRAGVSRRTYYERFESKDDCLLAAYEFLHARIEDAVTEAIKSRGGWALKVRFGLEAALDVLAAEPELAYLCVVESTAAGPAVAERHEETVGRLVPLLRAGRESGSRAETLPDELEEAVIGGLIALVASQLRQGRSAADADLRREVVELALVPYRAPEEVAEVLGGEP